MRVALASKPRSAIVAAPTVVLEPFSLFEIGIMFALAMGRLWRNCSVVRSPDLLMLSRLYVSTGFGPTSSAVGMFEPVTMTRSAVAAAGKIFPWASRAGVGATTCAGRFDTMAKKIAPRNALLRNNPHFGSWNLFIFVLLCPTNTQNGCK